MVLALTGSYFAGKRVGTLGRSGPALADIPVPGGLESHGGRIDPSALRSSRITSYAGRPAVRRAPGVEKALDSAEVVVPSDWLRRDSTVISMANERGIPVLSEVELAY